MENILLETAIILLNRINEADKKIDLSYSKERIMLNTKDDIIILSRIEDFSDYESLLDYLATFKVMLKAINNKIGDETENIIMEKNKIRDEIKRNNVLNLQKTLKGLTDE